MRKHDDVNNSHHHISISSTFKQSFFSIPLPRFLFKATLSHSLVHVSPEKGLSVKDEAAEIVIKTRGRLFRQLAKGC